MRKHVSYAVLCLAGLVLACEEPDPDEVTDPGSLELSQLTDAWQFVDSRYTVDSVVCGVTCFTSRSAWETLVIAADSSFWRLACTASAGRAVTSRSLSCSTVLVNSVPGSSVCELDSGRCSLATGRLCLAGVSATACYTATLSGDGVVLTLVDTLGVSRSYLAQMAP